MWISRFKSISNNGVTQASSSSSISNLHYLVNAIHAHYSTKSTEKHPILEPHFMVDYLVSSLGFSRDQAFSASTKVIHLKSTEKPDSVVDFFKRCGLDKTQIRSIVRFSPKILTASVDKTLEPKLKVFQELGLSGIELEKLFKPSTNFSINRLDSNVNYLRNLLGCNEKVVKVLSRSWWLLSSNFTQKLSANMLVLKKHGLSDDRIEAILIRNPGLFLQTPEWLEETITKVKPILGIHHDSPRFLDGIEIIASMNKSTLDMKFGIYRSFGWSDAEILTMTTALPVCLRGSRTKIQTSLNFFMNKLGYTAAYLAAHPKLLVYSLEKRILPRHKALEILEEKKLLKTNFSFCSVVALSEMKFVEDFVLPYRDRVPDLYEVYTNTTGHLQVIK